MGMAASQVRLLQLTWRKNDIGRELASCANQKMSLTREMQKVNEEYREDMFKKSYKWTNNGGATYVNLNYNNLMKPTAANKYQPYLLTDTAGKIVVNKEYEKYAKMISEYGSSGGNWESVRSEVLADIIGISESDFVNFDKNQELYKASQTVLASLAKSEPTKINFQKNTCAADILSKAGLSTDGISFSTGSAWNDAYSLKATFSIGSTSDIDAVVSKFTSVINDISNNVSPLMLGKEAGFKTKCETTKNLYVGFIENWNSIGSSNLQKENSIVKLSSNSFSINVQLLMDYLLADFKTGNDAAGAPLYEWYDTKSEQYQQYAEKYANWKADYDQAHAIYTESKSIIDTLFTSDQRSKINFYETLFSSIADNGWSYSSETENSEYLNQMLQNNLYTITTVTAERTQNEDSGLYEWNNIYNVDIASNMKNLVLVSDTDAQNEALTKYEHAKGIINRKESRIDIRMQDLRTEQDAVNTMIQSIDSQKEEWIERTFNQYS